MHPDTDAPRRSAASWVVAALGALYYATPIAVPLVQGRPAGLALVLVLVVPAVLGLVALRWRESSPVTVAVMVAVLLAISPTVAGAAFVSQEAVARRSRAKVVAGTGAAFLAAKSLALVISAEPGRASAVFVEATLTVAGIAIATLVGLLSASRRQARDSAERAEQDAVAARINEARLAERERIAREMHDVVAHRISLVALHAGALAHRSDLVDPDVREAARLIKENAQASLDELRSMLVTLRGADAPPATRQPTLDDLDVLIADAEEVGQRVSLERRGDLRGLPSVVSRHAFRIVQECVTNARKHAPGAPVTVTLDASGGRLAIRARNPLADLAPADRSGVGLGLIGVAERVALIGGRVRSGVEGREFVVDANLPFAGQRGTGKERT